MNQRLVALLITALIILIFDFYIWQIWRTLFANNSEQIRRIVKYSYWTISLLSLSYILYAFSGVQQPKGDTLAYWVFVGFAIIYFAKIFSLPFLLIDDLWRGVQMVFGLFKPKAIAHEVVPGEGISRSEFLLKVAAGASAIPLIGMTSGILFGAHNYQVRKTKVALPKLPPAFEGFKILQISDVHSGSFWNKNAVKKGIELINEQGADIVVFTGDLVNTYAAEFDEWKDIFKTIKAPMGVYSILGNHDYGDYAAWPSPQDKINNFKKLIQHHYDMGWDLLMDTHRIIEKDGQSINLIGIQNWGTGRFPKYGSVEKAIEKMPTNKTNILLSHDPSHWDEQVRKQFPFIDLMLSGHTHGMQFGIQFKSVQWSPVKYRYKQWSGLYKEGNQQLYVNQGFGYIGYPGRIGMPPEITVLELTAQA